MNHRHNSWNVLRDWVVSYFPNSLQWRHTERNGVSNHQPHDCLLNRLFRRRSKKTSKLRVTGLCVGNSPVNSEFPAQMASNAENVSIWWRHHVTTVLYKMKPKKNFSDWWLQLIEYFESITTAKYVTTWWNNRMAWQWAETLVEIRGTLADIRGTTKLGCRWNFPKHEFNRPVCLEAHHYLLAHLSQ